MKKDGKYRFSIQFGMTSQEKIRAGELLERLGNRKSRILIAALIEYMENHPEVETEGCELNVSFPPVPMDMLEAKIRQLVEERLSGISLPVSEQESQTAKTKAISQDIMDMLEDLEMF